MKFVKVKGWSKHVIGTGLVGYITSSYDELVRKFGRPSIFGSVDHKTQVEWIIKVGKVYFTIYDYKEGVPYDKVTLWHIGGHNANDITSLLRQKGFIMRKEWR